MQYRTFYGEHFNVKVFCEHLNCELVQRHLLNFFCGHLFGKHVNIFIIYVKTSMFYRQSFENFAAILNRALG